MNKKNPKDLARIFFNNTGNSYDRIVNWTTFGRDNFWKKRILENISKEKKILDLACGTGILTRKIAQKMPQSIIIGGDISDNYLTMARKNLNSFQNVSFQNLDAEKFQMEQKFDCITASYLPKYCQPDVLIRNCLEHLNKEGKLILHDFTYPKNKIIRKTWNFYFILLHLFGFFIPKWKQVFIELPHLIRSSNWLEDYEKAMKNNEMRVHKQEFTFGTSAIIVGIKII